MGAEAPGERRARREARASRDIPSGQRTAGFIEPELRRRDGNRRARAVVFSALATSFVEGALRVGDALLGSVHAPKMPPRPVRLGFRSQKLTAVARERSSGVTHEQARTADIMSTRATR